MKRFALSLLVLALLIGFARRAAAERTPEEIFHDANRSMDAGRYDEAAEDYRALLSKGHENGSIHGNLGQALFREGKLGEALFHLRRAVALKPRDPDLEANLRYLRSQTTDKIKAVPPNAMKRLLGLFGNEMNRKENWIGFLVLWFVFWMFAAGRLFWKKDLLRWSSGIVGGGLILMSASLIQKEFFERPFGVVVSPEAKVYSGPGEANVLLFELHEGAEVSLLPRSQDGWVSIQLADGKKGWMEGLAIMSRSNWPAAAPRAPGPRPR